MTLAGKNHPRWEDQAILFVLKSIVFLEIVVLTANRKPEQLPRFSCCRHKDFLSNPFCRWQT